MKLLPDWKDVMKRAWSLRFIEIAVLLGIIDGALALLMPKQPPLWMAFAGPAAGALAWAARLMAQRERKPFWTDEGGAARKRIVIGSGVVAAVMAASVPLVQKWEGLRTEAYQDVVGVWTVCYGETEGVQPGDSYTPDECAAMLEPRLIQDYYLPVVKCAPELADAPVEVQAAVTSWTYNEGVGAACRSTLARYLRAGEWESACNELPRWSWAGGQIRRGLVNRRADERGLCLSGVE